MQAEAHSSISTYDLAPKSADHGHIHESMFGHGALCSSVPVEGCDRAVAATSWNFETQSDLYNSDGKKKQPWRCKCAANVLLPEVILPNVSETEEIPHTVKRFLTGTGRHENGHVQACWSVIRAVDLFVSALPPAIPKGMVSSMNAAVTTFIKRYYVTRARTADVMFDKGTEHGGKYDAGLGSDPNTVQLVTLLSQVHDPHLDAWDPEDEATEPDGQL